MRSWIIGALAACLMLGVAPAVPAQEARGTLQGRVSDSTGAVVPGATVEVANVATGVAISTTSNEEGNYRFPGIPPGVYRVQYELTGFGTVVREAIRVTLAARRAARPLRATPR